MRGSTYRSPLKKQDIYQVKKSERAGLEINQDEIAKHNYLTINYYSWRITTQDQIIELE